MQLTGDIALELRSGPRAGERRVLSPREAYRLGRAGPADWALGDPRLATVHLIVGHRDGGWWVAPSPRAHELLLGGVPVTGPAPLTDGAWLRAGATDLSVYGVAIPEGPPALDAHRPVLDALLAMPNLYFVLDAARGPRVLELLRRSADDSACLFSGATRATLEDVAPYLVRPGSALLERIVVEGWDARWGVGLTSGHAFSLVRRHLRSILWPDVDGIGPCLLRFYDPGALTDLWEIATPAQRSLLLGRPPVVDAFLAITSARDPASGARVPSLRINSA